MRDFPRAEQQRISKRMAALALEPRPNGVEKLTATDSYRVRQGNYRIVYLIDDANQVVTITRVGHQRDAYR